jgi:hypothetical protein
MASAVPLPSVASTMMSPKPAASANEPVEARSPAASAHVRSFSGSREPIFTS